MNKLFTKIATAVVGFAMAIGVGAAVANNHNDVREANAAGEETLTFSTSSYPFGTGGYSDNTTGVSHATSASTNITIKWTQTYKVGNGIQIKKGTSNGFYSSSTISSKYISSIKVTNHTNSGTIYMSVDGSSWTSGMSYTSGTAKEFSDDPGYKYFKIGSTKDAYCILSQIIVTYSTIPVKTLDAVSSISATVTAKQNASSWTVTNFTATGTISGTSNQNVTNYVDYVVNTAVPSTTQTSYTVQFTVSKKADKTGDFTSDTFSITNATVTADPFLSYTLVTSIDNLNSHTLYALGNADKEIFAKNAISNSQMATSTTDSDIGLFRLEPTKNSGKYYLQFQTGSSFPYTGGKYVNHTAGSTSISNSESGVAEWEAIDGSGKVYMLHTSDTSNRFLGLGTSGSNTIVKAYSTSSTTYEKLYLYSVSTDTLSSITPVSNTTSFKIGTSFAFGGTITASYSISGTTGHTGLSTGLSFLFKGTGGTEYGSMPASFEISHNGGSVKVTYTDAWGSTASATYTISVTYDDVTSIVLKENNQTVTSKTISLTGSVSLAVLITPSTGDPNVDWTITPSSGLVEDTNYYVLYDDEGFELEMDPDNTTGGTITITATATGYISDMTTPNLKATCVVTVSANPVLTLFEGQNDVTGESLSDRYTGDDSILLSVVALSFVGNITYSWSSSNTSAIDIDEEADDMCSFAIVGPGVDVELSCNAVGSTSGNLTVTATVSVIESAVTSITLGSSVDGGVIYDQSYNNSLVLTPTLTKVGNASSLINWESSDDDVAIVSSEQTNGTSITVSAVTNSGSKKGTEVVITATSDYSDEVYAEYTVTVKNDGIDSIQWTGTSASQMTGIAGVAQLTESVVNTSWSISATWFSGKVDSGLQFGDYTLKIGEKTIDSLPYTFELEDNNQSLTITYNGKTKTAGSKPVIIESLNTIKKSVPGSAVTATYTATDGGNMTSSTTGTITDTQSNNWSFEVANYSNWTGGDKTYYQFGSNKSGTGSLSLSLSSVGVVTSVSVYCASSNGHTLTVQVGSTKYADGAALSGLNNSYCNTYTYPNGTSTGDISISISGGEKGMYFKGFSITYTPMTETTYSNQDYATQKAVLDFVKTFNDALDDVCVMSGATNLEALSGAWGDLSTAYTNARNGLAADTSMTKAERQTLFDNIFANATKSERDSSGETPIGDSLQKALARYDWILKNHTSLTDFISTTSGRPAAASTRVTLISMIANNNNLAAVIVILSMISIAAVGGYYFLRKRKED